MIANNLPLTELARTAIGVYAQHLGMNIEGDTVVLRNDDTLLVATTSIRQIDSTVRCYLYVAMKIGALGKIVGRYTRTEGQAAVVAARAESNRGVLRAIINCIWIDRTY